MICPKVTVSIPVYNTERYIRQCLDSLMNQTMRELEFIVVDDGSTDCSGRICDEYALRDTRFKVIHQQNGGLASARQVALDMAQGEYVIVCDSDDWVEPDIYECLYKAAQRTDADIVLCGYYAEYESGRSIPRQPWFKEKEGFIDNQNCILYGASWAKLVKRSLFERAHATYEMGINMGEDKFIHSKLMKANPRIVQISACLYHYRRLFGESTYTNMLKMTSVLQMNHIYEWLEANYPEKIYEKQRRQFALDIAVGFLRVDNLDRSFYVKFLACELPWKRLLVHGVSLKSVVVALEKIFPIAMLRRLLGPIRKIVYA